MKKKIAFLGAAVSALMMAGAAHAEAGASYVGLSYSDNDSSTSSWGVNGAFAAGPNFQLDAGYASVDGGDANVWNIGGHFFSRNDSWLWGGFVGYDNLSGAGDNVGEWTVAAQTQFYMDRTTLSGNLSYSQSDDAAPFGKITTTAIDGEARFFATDNFSIQGSLGYGNVDFDVGGSGTYWSYGIGAEFKPDSAPVSFFGGWQGFNGDGSDFNGWQVGIRYNWGGTLLERNRSGASLSEPRGFVADVLL